MCPKVVNDNSLQSWEHNLLCPDTAKATLETHMAKDHGKLFAFDISYSTVLIHQNIPTPGRLREK